MDFRITNLQVLQSVQTFANTMPLVGYKPTFVKVALKSNEANHGPWMVTARLDVFDIASSQQHTLLPINFNPDFAITASPAGSHPDRWGDGFTFLLEYGDTKPGDRVFTARVFSGAEEGTPPPDHVRSYQMRFHPYVSMSTYGLVWAETAKDPLHVEVPIGTAAPWSDFDIHRQYVESAYPIAHFSILPIPGIGTAAPNPQPFTTITGANKWAVAMLANLPPGAKINVLENWDTGGFHGWASSQGLSEEENPRDSRAGVTMAQELAHLAGIWCHTFDPCINGTPYPRPSGQIDPQDLGFNLSTRLGHPIELVSWGGERDVFDGVSANGPLSDFMSYNGRPLWISSFTYCQLVGALWSVTEDRVCVPGVRRDVPQARLPEIGAAPQAYLLVEGTLRADGTASLDGLEVAPSLTDVSTPQGFSSDRRVEILDAAGMVLLTYPFPDQHSDHDGPVERPFHVVLPFEVVREAAAKLVVREAAGNLLVQRTFPALPPVVSQLSAPTASPVTGFVAGPQTVSWLADDPAALPLHYTLLYSADGGTTWWPVNTALTGLQAVVDFDSLPGSDAALLKIRASNDGRSTERVSTTPFKVERRAPRVSIDDLVEGATVDARVPLLLQGRASTWEDGELAGDGALSWRTDAAPLGAGSYVVVRSLTPGPLAITLRATAPDGRAAETTVHVVVVPGG